MKWFAWRCSLMFFTVAVACPGLEAAASVAARVQQEYTTQHLSVQLASDEQTQATLRLPKNLRAGERVPLFLVFGGFESAAKVLELVQPRAPAALASFDYPFTASRKWQFPQSLSALPEAKALLPKTVRGIADLIKSLKQLPQIDSKRIVMIGASFGAPFALAAASEDPGISSVVLVHAFGRPAETLENVILRSWLPRYGWMSRPLAWMLSRLGWLYLNIPSPEDLARHLQPHQAVLMITAANDSFIPRASSDSLWDALLHSPAHATRLMMPTDHLMPGSEELIHEIIRRVETWMSGASLIYQF